MSDALSYSDATWPEVEEAGEGFVALLPVGSTEAHGPHLPLSTDVIIATGMAQRAARMLVERGTRAMCLPALPYAVTDCAAEFPGTVSVNSEGVQRLIADIAVSVTGQGAALLCLANGHLEPDHRRCLQGALALAAERGAKVVFPDNVRKPWALELGDEFKSGACHAGSYETSLVLALRPDLVRKDLQRDLPEFPVSIGKALAEGKRTFKEAGSESAYFGDPAAASAEEGEQLLATLARMLVEEVESAL